ncbi:MAG: hypothetical protein JSS98_17955 [Bacteroidetes bacterium]|nr:hypothetical protein [Bacteroidota bacterium]
MKNKIRFIMPRLIGATVIIGVAAFVITVLFKLLLGLSLLAGVVLLGIRLMGKKGRRQLQHHPRMMPAFVNPGTFGKSSATTGAVHPVAGFARAKETSIVPID